MIISDGTTSVTYASTLCAESGSIDKSNKATNSGRIVSQTSGMRFSTSELIHMSGTEWRTLKTLLSNQAEFYYYTPTFTPQGMLSSDFPMTVQIDLKKVTPIGGGDSYRYTISLEIQGVDYL